MEDGLSLNPLEVDTTYGSMDPTLAKTHFTLPSAYHSKDFDDEEAQLEELIEKLDQVYPANMSHSCKLQEVP